MDALPISEENDTPYASQVPGAMHACGHDAHTAMLLGVAWLLHDKHLPGQIRLFCQPSEEDADENSVKRHARAVIAEAAGRWTVLTAVMALGVNGSIDAGLIHADDGWIGAAMGHLRGHVMDSGGHAAYPHQTLDPIWLIRTWYLTHYTPFLGRISLLPSVITVGIVRGGTADNVIPASVYVEGTIRSMDEAVRTSLPRTLRCLLDWRGPSAAIINWRSSAAILRSTTSRRSPAGCARWPATCWAPRSILTGQQGMGAEDFSYMTQHHRARCLGWASKRPAAAHAICIPPPSTSTKTPCPSARRSWPRRRCGLCAVSWAEISLRPSARSPVETDC